MKNHQKVLQIVSEVLNIPEEKIVIQENLTNLVQDSIQLFDLLIRLESAFQTKVNYDEIAHIETVEDIIHYADLKYGNT